MQTRKNRRRYWLIAVSVAVSVPGKEITEGIPIIGPENETVTDTADPCARGVVLGFMTTLSWPFLNADGTASETKFITVELS